jgi:hypothetical protein
MTLSPSRLSALLASLVVLAGCATPQGTPVPTCGDDFEAVLQGDPRAMTNQPQSIAVECYRIIGNARIEVGFLMPAGPQCFEVESVEVSESSEAVSLELRVGGVSDPFGACPEEELPWSVLVELNGPIEGREVLDAVGSG